MFLARFLANLQRKIDLTNAFKSIFRDDSFKQCSEIARVTKSGTCGVPYHEAPVRASGKDLAQGQVALIDPI